MAQDFDPVFGSWYTEKSLGSGTDGKAFLIKRKTDDGTEERAVLKTIRVGDYRNEKKSFNKLSSEVSALPEEDTQRDKIIHNITENIEIIQKADRGKHFVKYEEWEKRATSDGKGTLILIRLEEMRSLTQLLEQFSLTEDEAVRLGISVCNSLNRCRDFGYIYPNLKPENILFDRNGVCKLGDLGSFSCLEPSRTSVAYQRTQYYMAPEFIESGKINCTSDTYALALVLYTLVNRGRLPFTEPYPQELTVASLNRSRTQRVANQPLPRPALAGDGLWHVIQRACAFRPEERYLSPKQMRADLEHVLQHEPLEKAQFDDVFSRSKPARVEETPVQIEPIPAPPDMPAPPAPPAYPGPEEAAVSSEDAVSVPKARPQGAREARPQQKKRPLASRISLPRPGASGRKPAIPREKQILIFALAAILLLILLIVSLSLKAKGAQMPQTTPVFITSVFDGGVSFWPLI